MSSITLEKILYYCSFILIINIFFKVPIPVAAWCKAWVWGRSLAGTAVSNPAWGRESVSLVECCGLSLRGLSVGLITRPEESYRVWRV